MQEKQYRLKGGNGRYFITGAGFTGTVEQATKLNQGAVTCATNLGFIGTAEEVKAASFAVVYIRKGEGARLLSGLGKNTADANKGQVDPSKRRFATFDEAVQHGIRFSARRKAAGDKPGSAGHEGFFVVESFDAVNSAINWKTGLTNSL